MEDREVTRGMEFYEEFSPSVSFHSLGGSSLTPSLPALSYSDSYLRKNLLTFLFVLPLKFHQDSRGWKEKRT